MAFFPCNNGQYGQLIESTFTKTGQYTTVELPGKIIALLVDWTGGSTYYESRTLYFKDREKILVELYNSYGNSKWDIEVDNGETYNQQNYWYASLTVQDNKFIHYNNYYKSTPVRYIAWVE